MVTRLIYSAHRAQSLRRRACTPGPNYVNRTDLTEMSTSDQILEKGPTPMPESTSSASQATQELNSLVDNIVSKRLSCRPTVNKLSIYCIICNTFMTLFAMNTAMVFGQRNYDYYT